MHLHEPKCLHAHEMHDQSMEMGLELRVRPIHPLAAVGQGLYIAAEQRRRIGLRQVPADRVRFP